MRIVTRQKWTLSQWRRLNSSDKEWYVAYDAYLLENEAERYKTMTEAIEQAGKKKGFGVIAVMLHALFKLWALRLNFGGD